MASDLLAIALSDNSIEIWESKTMTRRRRLDRITHSLFSDCMTLFHILHTSCQLLETKEKWHLNGILELLLERCRSEKKSLLQP